MYAVSWLIVIVGALGNFIIGLVTYLRNTKSATNRWFGLFSFLLALYLILNQFSITQNNEASTLFWIRAVMVVAPAIVFSFFMLAKVFPREKMEVSRKLFLGSIFATLLAMALGTTGLFFESVSIFPSIKPTPGKLVPLFLLYNVFFIGWSTYLLFRKFRKSSGMEKTQLKYLIFGAAVMFSLIFLSNIILVILFNISTFVVFVPIYTLVFVGLTSYAIVRFGLFDIRVVATEATTAVLCTVLFAKIFSSQNQTETLIDLAIFVVVVIFGIFLVRSVRREVEQKRELETLNKRLNDLDQQKDEFLNIASHELRAPMTAVKGYVSMVQGGDGGEVPVAAQELLAEAATESDRMIRLVNNMLDVARIEEDRMVFEPGEVLLHEVVERVFKEFKFEADSKALMYSYNPEQNLSDRVTVDIDRIHEVVTNLISNAIKYTDEGKVSIKLFNPPSPKTSEGQAHQLVRFEVTDTGPGMTEDEKKKLFQKFYRAESYVGKKIGTGLGLYISRLLVEKFGGQIGVSSEKGKGSTFWFALPTKTLAS